jgi:hypothetical protein
MTTVAATAPPNEGGNKMVSRPLLTAEAAHAQRTAEQQRAAEVAQRYPGWHVWTARKGNTRVATRTAGQEPPDPDDGTWAKTVIADDWTELEHELAAQAQYDAERTYQ